MIHYCPTCPWRWNTRFEGFNNNCNFNLAHTCFDLHEKEEIEMTYSTKSRILFYICKTCNETHSIKVEKNQSIKIDCKKYDNTVTNLCYSWNTSTRFHCSRCNTNRVGLVRGHLWYCNNCNNYIINHISGHRTVLYNIHETTAWNRKFHCCNVCGKLSLIHTKMFTCCNQGKRKIVVTENNEC